MEQLHEIIKKYRLKKGLLVKDVAHSLKIDSAMVSRYEKGERLPSENVIAPLAEILGITTSMLTKYWLSQKVFDQLKHYPEAKEVVYMVEEKMAEYIKVARVSIGTDLKKLLLAADEIKKDIRQFHPLNTTQLVKLQEYFNTNYTYESNRIEGNTLSLQETSLVINEGITISGKSMREHLEAINHTEALVYIQDIAREKKDITERLIKEMHYLVLKTIDKENAGQYRKTDVRITGSQHIPVSHFDVSLEMEKLIKYYHLHKKSLHPILLAADLHWMLAGVHPFIDGNGRTSRLLMNLILIQHGYCIANLKGDVANRLQYYKSLETAQVSKAPETFRKLVIETAIEGLKEYKGLIKST